MAVIGQDVLRDTQQLPWAPVVDGIWFKLVETFDEDSGWVSLLRVRPDTVVGRHRHTGEVHGFVLRGIRKLMDDSICGPGAYVYEPAGNTDSWASVGDDDLVSLFIVSGSVEYLTEDGSVEFRETAASKRASWEEFRRQYDEGTPAAVALSDVVGDTKSKY